MERDVDSPARRWPLRGFWRAWYWISAMIAAVLAALGLGMLVLAFWVPLPPKAILLLTAVVLLAVGAIMVRQLVTTVLDVTLAPDGTITLRRLGGTIHTHATHVRLVRLSVLVSGSHTPAVIETSEGFARSIHPRAQLDDLVAAIRRYNPTLGDRR